MSQASLSTPMVQGLKAFYQQGKPIRRCKIIGTMGPASSSEEMVRELMQAGLDIFRVNFSHGSHEDHAATIKTIRRVAKECGLYATILQDLQGPKIRCGKLLNGQLRLEKDARYHLQYGEVQTDPMVIPIDYRYLCKDIHVGEAVMMDDGLLLLRIESIETTHAVVRVEEGGILKSRKGVNFPDSHLSVPPLTEKDNKDLLFGVTQHVDAIALSFVQTAKDVAQCKKIIQALGSDIPVIAKIEKLSAVQGIDEIASISDGLMVARGDLGVECRVERVPGFQRKIIEAAAKYSVPVIVATQMLESMVENPRATLAEVADVANAVLEGADCIMLSAEVAVGKYPVACVQKMVSIIEEVEGWVDTKTQRYEPFDRHAALWQTHTAIARAVCEAADNLHARAIVCLTLTGSIARLISSWRPKTPIIAISPRTDVIHRLGFMWGVHSMQNPLFYDTDVLLQDLPRLLKSLHVVQSGDVIVITAGIPINEMKSTNMIKINQIE